MTFVDAYRAGRCSADSQGYSPHRSTASFYRHQGPRNSAHHCNYWADLCPRQASEQRLLVEYGSIKALNS